MMRKTQTYRDWNRWLMEGVSYERNRTTFSSKETKDTDKSEAESSSTFTWDAFKDEYEVSSEAVAYAIEQGGEKEGALEALLESCFAWLQTVRQAEVASILIDQGPRVLGWERARELEGKTSYRPMRKSLERAVAEGAIRVESVPLATRFINAMLTEAAMELLYSESRVSKRKTELMLRQFIEGLRA